MKRVFALLLRLYPAARRDLLGDEMLQVFAEAAAEYRARGRWAYTRFAVTEMMGLLLGAVVARTDWRRPDRGLDLRMMRPPEVSKETYATAIDELVAAQQMVAENLALMQDAIARHEFVKARFYSDEERKARVHLRVIHRKYRIAE